VTERYLPFWREFADPRRWATGSVPRHWQGKFDLVCSFYVLEHVADPVAIVTEMGSLLKPGGVLYFLVPNVLANSADLVVADHLQHYSESSLRALLALSGLETLLIDDQSHDAAYVVAARNPTASHAEIEPAMKKSLMQPTELHEKYQMMAGFWSNLADRIEDFERQHRDRNDACIYGAGFYGNFIASCLHDPRAVTCFVDQNPYLQGRSVQGKPVVSPPQLAADISLMYVGLNPAVARSVISGIGCWSGRQFDTFYL
jgi:SAM-dependent methyltransferase